MKYIVFDIDGTLADISHRLHFIQGEKKDWDGFFGAVADDKPIHEMVTLCQMLMTATLEYKWKDKDGKPDEVDVVFVSGRPMRCGPATMKWLQKHVVPEEYYPFMLKMREDGDHRDDSVVKQEILKELESEGEILFTVDDRQRVVDMWRANGIRCLQCDFGCY